MAKNKKHLEITLKGYTWKVYCQSNSAFTRKHGNGVYHVVYPEEREIFYNKKYFSFDFVLHELCHALLWCTDTEHSQHLSQDDVEDLCVTTFSKNYFEIGRIAKEIINYFGGELKC